MTRDWIIGVAASLAAAISLLENTPKANKAAPSNKMFDQMLKDYKKSLRIARAELRKLNDGFTRKTYRCEWVAEVYEVDQYGFRQGETWYLREFPTREQALAHLERILVQPSSNVNRPGNWPDAKHGYYDCGVRYREVECN